MKIHTFFTLAWCHVSSFLLAGALSAAAAELVEPRSGQLVAASTDLAFDAGAVRIELHRMLQPPGGAAGLLGTRWRMDWDTRLTREATGVTIHRGFIREMFTPSGAGFRSVDGSSITFAADGSAILQNPDGTRDEYSAPGRLVARDLRNGNRLTFDYDAKGRLTRVTGPQQSWLNFLLDESGRLARVESSTGEVVRYQFEQGELAAVDTTRQPGLRYSYTAGGSLARIESVPGGVQTLAYDLFDRVISHAQENGVRHYYAYDDATRTTRRTDSAGRVTVMNWSADGLKQTITHPDATKSTLEYDVAGHLIRSIGPDGVEGRFVYDARGRQVAAQNVACCSGQIEYDGDSTRPKLIISPEGARTELAYDARGNLTRISADGRLVGEMTWAADGLPASERDADGRTRRYSYDAAGRLASVTDNLNRTTRYEYDTRGNLVRESNAAGGVTSHAFDRRNRRLTTTDPTGGITRHAYDEAGLLAGVTDPLGRETRYSYLADGSLAAVTDAAGRVTGISSNPDQGWARLTSPNGLITTERVGADGQLTEVTDALGRLTRYTYNAAGHLTAIQSTNSTERYTYDASQRLIASESSGSGKSSFQWDDKGRLAARTDSAGGVEKYAYDTGGRLAAQTDERGGTRRFEYSSGGRLTALASAGGDRVRLEYDADGQLTQAVHPRGAVSKFRHDALGQATELFHPAAGTVRREFDAAGRLTTSTDALGKTARFAYDAAGRLTRKTLPGGQISYQYGPGDELLRVDDGKFPIDYQYDPSGNLSQISYGALKRSVRFQVNQHGSRTALIASDGRIIRYEYDDQQRLVKILIPTGGAVTFSYDQTDRIALTKYPNGTSARWTYDAAGHVRSLAWQNQAGQSIASWDHRHDVAGNPVAVTRTHGPALAFSYDVDGRLTGEQRGTATTSYTYLAGGDRSGRDRDVLKYDANERLAAAGGETFVHDAAGRPVTRTGPKGATRYEWDEHGRLARATAPGGATVQFGYAGTSERVWREDKNGRVYFLQDGPNLLEELDANGTNLTLYIHGPDLDRPVAMVRGGKTYFFHHDALGTVDLVTDSTGKVVARHEVDAFGVVTRREGEIRSPFLFQGREYEEALGLYYFRARYYDPALGRFLTPDPEPPAVESADDLNRYVFARNAPTRFGDPLGTAALDVLNGLSPEQLWQLATRIGWATRDTPLSQMNPGQQALAQWASQHLASANGAGAIQPVVPPSVSPTPAAAPVSGGVSAAVSNPNIINMADALNSSAPRPIPPAPVPPAAPVPGTAGAPVNPTVATPVPPSQRAVPWGQTVKVPQVTPTPTITPGQLLAGARNAAGVGAVLGGVNAYANCVEAGLSEAVCRRRGAVGAVSGGVTAIGMTVGANMLTAAGHGALVAGAGAVGAGVAVGVGVLQARNIVMGGAHYLAARDREATATDRLAAMGQRLNDPARGGASLDALRGQVGNLRKELEAIHTAGRLLNTAAAEIDTQNKAVQQIAGQYEKISKSDALLKAAQEADKSLFIVKDFLAAGTRVNSLCEKAVESLEQSAPGKWPASEASLRAGDAKLQLASDAYRELRAKLKNLKDHLATREKFKVEATELDRKFKESRVKRARLVEQALGSAKNLTVQREQWSRQQAGLQMSVARLRGIAADKSMIGIIAAIGKEVDSLTLPNSPNPERIAEGLNDPSSRNLSDLQTKQLVAWNLIDRTEFFEREMPGAQQRVKDAEASVLAAIFTLARYQTDRITIFDDLVKKKTVTKDLATKADGRDTALKTEKTRREAELKKPNLSVADRDRTTVLLKQIDQAIVKNQDQKDEAVRQTKETEKAEAAIKPEIDLLGVTMQRAQKAVNDP